MHLFVNQRLYISKYLKFVMYWWFSLFCRWSCLLLWWNFFFQLAHVCWRLPLWYLPCLGLPYSLRRTPLGWAVLFVPHLSASSFGLQAIADFLIGVLDEGKNTLCRFLSGWILRASLTRSDSGSAWVAFSFEKEVWFLATTSLKSYGFLYNWCFKFLREFWLSIWLTLSLYFFSNTMIKLLSDIFLALNGIPLLAKSLIWFKFTCW